jgi:hypothetical protein
MRSTAGDRLDDRRTGCFLSCLGGLLPRGSGGRPLVVEGAPRVASEVPRSEWLPSVSRPSWEALRARVSHISPALREGLADHYAREASFEHASVASFAAENLAFDLRGRKDWV